MKHNIGRKQKGIGGKVKDTRTEREKAFVEGMWYAVERCVDCGDDTLATHIITESNIPEWEFRQVLKETEYMEEELTELLNYIFKGK